MLSKLVTGVQEKLKERNVEVGDEYVQRVVIKFREEEGGMTGRKMAELITIIASMVIENAAPAAPTLSTRYVRPAHLEDR